MCNHNISNNLKTNSREALGVTFNEVRCQSCGLLIEKKIYYQGKEIAEDQFKSLLSLTPYERSIAIALNL